MHEVKEKVDRQNNPYEFFIAGDHMDTDELHLLRRGTFAGSDVGPAFIRVFKPGQVLYGSRRTYLRKVAVADFEGVTANTTFVLETKDESILIQRLLPFIMQSERFVQHSIKRSKGSTNPYVLFSDLCDYEVDLPDIETQKRLAEVLWTMDEVRMAYKKLIAATDELVKSQFLGEILSKDYPVVDLISLIKKGAGLSYGIVQPGDDGTGEMGVLRPVDIVDGRIITSGIKYIDRSIGKSYQRTELTGKEILITVRGTTGITAITDSRFVGMNVTRGIAVIRYDTDKVDPIYLNAYLKSDISQYYIQDHTKGIALKQINIADLKVQPIILPPMSFQTQFATFVRQSDKSKFELEQALSELNATYKRIISEQLG